MNSAYAAFLAQKERVFHGDGISAAGLPAALYYWQAAVVRWALRKGRAAIFADCGLGKTFMQVSWANALPSAARTLILAPLCVAEQTVGEARKLGIPIQYAHDGLSDGRIVITNYERLERFDPQEFQAVVLDESSILKAFNGKTRTKLIQAFGHTQYRLCCTATPSPNDITELANHAEFLGLMTRPEFLATWFVHDDTGWRMKRHAVEPFYRWMASWAVAIRSPRDLGYDARGFDLPELRIHETVLDVGGTSTTLFPELSGKGLKGRLSSRRASLDDRVSAIAARVRASSDQWLIWCGLNTESDALARSIPDAVNVEGSDSYAEKASAVHGFTSGAIRVLISKPKILGFGMNFQQCSRMAFVGLGDSYEQYYQCIRRCWRYGQTRPVDVHLVVSEAERIVVENVRRKERAAVTMADSLLAHMAAFEREEISAA